MELALRLQAGLTQTQEIPEFDEEAYQVNQRDEGRAMGDIAGALMADAGMKQQNYITQPLKDIGVSAFHMNQRDEGIDLGDKSGALMATNNMQMQTFVTMPAAAGFIPESSTTAHDIGYQEECAPTLKAGGKSGAVLCLNDQGGQRMECSEDQAGTLRAQEHGHQPLVFSVHGQSATYTGPLECAPTVSASYGEGGNNVPVVADEDAIRIMGNTIDKAPENKGRSRGIKAVFRRQREDSFTEDDVAGTESARQSKDATDLVLVKMIIAPVVYLIRRLTPLECERLQGFPDGWTDLPGAKDTARYKALGNSVAVPCVDLLMQGIALAIKDSSLYRYSLKFKERKMKQ